MWGRNNPQVQEVLISNHKADVKDQIAASIKVTEVKSYHPSGIVDQNSYEVGLRK